MKFRSYQNYYLVCVEYTWDGNGLDPLCFILISLEMERTFVLYGNDGGFMF
jgi:hypothetical protein